jgi:ferredoxin
LNVELSEKWRDNNITEMKDKSDDAEDWDGVPDKLQYLEK